MDRLEALKQLVKRFDDNYREYKRDTYNEHSCRDEFINPFLEILGWDVTNSKGLAPHATVSGTTAGVVDAGF